VAAEAAAGRSAAAPGEATLVPTPTFNLDSLRAVLQEQIAPLNAATQRIEGRLETLEGNQVTINSRLDKLEANASAAAASAAPSNASVTSSAAGHDGADPLQRSDA
jgi:phage shock protein A